MKLQFVKASTKDKLVRNIIRKDNSVFFSYLTPGGFEAAAAIKITRFISNDTQKCICGTFAGFDFIVNTIEKTYMRISDDGMHHGKLSSELTAKKLGNGIEINYDNATGEYFYTEMKRKASCWVPVVVGDILKKDYHDFEVMAIGVDGSLFISEIQNKSSTRNQVLKSHLIRLNDQSAIESFHGLKVEAL